ncbi:MAG: cysteine desulfurase [Planctomycetes bacterium]|nr:cysteine desulfurase [Planctomycetota bacterium]
MYLDYNASTPVDPRVIDEMLPYFYGQAANAGSINHRSGRVIASLIEECRADVARLMQTDGKDLIFTSGATESINIALKGLAKYREKDGKHIICSAIEHKAVFAVYESLRDEGWRMTVLPVNEDAQVSLADVQAAIEDDTVLLSMIHANNETGTIQDIKEIGLLCREHGISYHVDAAQSLGKIPIDVNDSAIDLLSCSAHKMYGPKGIGALYVRRRNPRTRLLPILHGGAQERGFRPGTLNVTGIVGFAAAARIAEAEMEQEQRRHQTLRQKILTLCNQLIPDIRLNGAPLETLATTINIMCKGVDVQSLLCSLGEIDLAMGSACTSSVSQPSHVLRAMGRSPEEAAASLRLSFGRFSEEASTLEAIHMLAQAVSHHRAEAHC